MSRVMLIAVAALAALAAGCRSSPCHPLAIEYHPGREPGTFQAPYAATYKLFVIDGAGPTLVPIDQSAIQRRYHVGFVRQPDGSLVGYAGGRKIPLPEGHYRWEITPESWRTPGSVARERVGDVLAPVMKTAVLICVGAVTIAAKMAFGIAGGGHGASP